MSQIKISQLPETSSSTPADYISIVQNGNNKKIKLSSLLNTLNSTTNIQLNPGRAPISIIASSVNLPYLLFLSCSSDFVGINTNTPQSRLHVNGNIQVGDASDNGLVIHGEDDVFYSATADLPLGLSWFKPLNSAKDTSVVSIDAGVSVGQFDLVTGQVGQYKVITYSAGPTGSKATIRVTAGLGFDRIDLTTKGSSVTLKCINLSNVATWVCAGSSVATLYTV